MSEARRYTAAQLNGKAFDLDVAGLPNLADMVRQSVTDAMLLQDARNTLTEITGLSLVLRKEGPKPEDLQELSNALEAAVRMAHEALSRIK